MDIIYFFTFCILRICVFWAGGLVLLYNKLVNLKLNLNGTMYIPPFYIYVFVLTVYYSINVLPKVSKAVLLKASFLCSRFSPYHVSTYLIMFLGCVMFHLFLSKTRRLESSSIPASSYLSIVNI